MNKIFVSTLILICCLSMSKAIAQSSTPVVGTSTVGTMTVGTVTCNGCNVWGLGGPIVAINEFFNPSTTSWNAGDIIIFIDTGANTVEGVARTGTVWDPNLLGYSSLPPATWLGIMGKCYLCVPTNGDP